MRDYRNYKGQTLIEVVVAVGVVVLLAVSLITTNLVTQKTSRSARNTTQATKLAQDYAEKIRIIRDRDGYEYIYIYEDDGKTQTCINEGCPFYEMPTYDEIGEFVKENDI